MDLAAKPEIGREPGEAAGLQRVAEGGADGQEPPFLDRAHDAAIGGEHPVEGRARHADLVGDHLRRQVRRGEMGADRLLGEREVTGGERRRRGGLLGAGGIEQRA